MSSPLTLRTFSDIYSAIREALGIQQADTAATNKIKRMVNMYYMNEVVPFKRWSWLQKNLQIVHNAYFNVGTVSVAPASTAIAFTPAPNVSLGSFAGYKFSTDNSNKVYLISAHTAGSASATITSAYQENVNATSKYKVWRDRVDLPTNAKETIQITHAEQSAPLQANGSQSFRKLEAAAPKREGFPSWYNTDTFFDPTNVDGEDDRYRQVRLYPSITTTPVTLSIDYVEDVIELFDDADEPIIPVEDRMVLYYGAGAQAWSLLERNEDMHDRWKAKADQKLARMAGDRDDGFDSPTITPNGRYVNSQRNAGLRRRRKGMGGGGQTSVSIPSYLKDVIINGGTLTADLAVNAGVLIGGVDVSSLAASELLASVALLDNASNQVVAAFPLSLYNAAHVDYAISRGTSILEVGQVKLAGTNAAASIAQGAIASVGDSGTTLSADISGASIRLLASTSSTGTAPTITFKVRKWNG